MHLNWVWWIPRIMARIFGIGNQWVNNHSLDFKPDYEGCFPALSMSYWWQNSIRLLSSRLMQCLGSVHTMAAVGCSKTAPAMHIKYARFSEWIILEILELWGSVSFQNVQNFI